ncbi:hypothetical protein AB0M43_09980 [Longispora sp. NPDC051575]|uniref:hypothetical protein n=1 Tax=Longispora sp. NPDC051575 TaxID=3154943 RepID=UPI003420E2F6
MALTGALCAVLPFVGSIMFSVPAAGDSGVASVPGWRIIAAGATFGPVLFCHSPFGEMESATGRNWRRVQLGVLALNATACSLLFFLTSLMVFGGPMALLVLRGIIGWMGTALLAARLLGWRAAWVGPLALLPIMIFWGTEGPQQYAWWEFTARPIDDPAAWVTAAGLLALGAGAHLVDRWRWRAAVTFLRRRTIRLSRRPPSAP